MISVPNLKPGILLLWASGTVGIATYDRPPNAEWGLCEWGHSISMLKFKKLCNCEETKALWGPLIRFGEGLDLCNWTNTELKAKSRRLVHGSLSLAELKQTPPIINNTPSFAWEPGQHTGLNAQHVAGIDPPSTICSCMNTLQKPPNSIPHTTKVGSSGRGQFGLRSFMFDELFWFWKEVWHSWHWGVGVGGQPDRGQQKMSCGKPAQAFPKQLAPLSPRPSARSTSWA